MWRSMLMRMQFMRREMWISRCAPKDSDSDSDWHTNRRGPIALLGNPTKGNLGWTTVSRSVVHIASVCASGISTATSTTACNNRKDECARVETSAAAPVLMRAHVRTFRYIIGTARAEFWVRESEELVNGS